jgi:protein-L-isoaspartate(D-aspartate) O-methyltransferase
MQPIPDVFAAARKHMVESQIRPNRVTDPRILSAMRRLPRERFLPPALHPLAYADGDVPLGNGRFLMEPMVLARMLQAAVLQPNERVLVVGAGCGYGAAVLAACGCRVTALEEDSKLRGLAESALAALPATEDALNIALVAGPLTAGWRPMAPYDLILIEGAVPEIPAALGQQIQQETGRIITALCRPGSATQAVQAEATTTGLSLVTLFDCGVHPIPAFRKEPGFAF